MKIIRCFIPSLMFLVIITILHFTGLVEFRHEWDWGRFLSGVFACGLSIDLFKATSPRYLRDE